MRTIGRRVTLHEAARRATRLWARPGALALGLFLVALVPRIVQPAVFVVGDELTWSTRSARFLMALAEGRLADTYQAPHPGVTTMWLDAIALLVSPGVDRAAITEVTTRPTLGDPDSLRLLAELMFASKWIVGVVTALAVALMYLLARSLVGEQPALLGAGLVALDPFYLAHSRVLHLDALLTSFMVLSVLALLAWVREDNRGPQTADGRRQLMAGKFGWLVISGFLAGLAALTKTTALFLVSFTGLVLLVTSKETPFDLFRFLRRTIVAGLIWSLAMVATYIALWPAMWVDPPGTFQAVLSKALGYADTPHESNFFWGISQPDPGPAFYPVALAFRLTPVTLLGLAAGLLAIWSWRRRREDTLRWLLAFIVLFTLFMTRGEKKFDRYLLPVFPMLDLFVGIGLWQIVATHPEPRPDGSSRPARSKLTLVGVLAIQALLVLPYHPYYMASYNLLVGGGPAAMRTLLVGWGEGMEEAAAYLNARSQQRPLETAVWVVAGFAPYYNGPIQHVSGYDPATADYMVLYISQVQRHIFADITDRFWLGQVPEYVVRKYGVDYAWIYPNLSYQAPLNYLANMAVPETDVIVTDKVSVFTRHYDGPTPLAVVESDSEADVMRRVTEATAGKRYVWYISYQTKHDGSQNLVRYGLATHAFHINQADFGDVRVTGYDLSGAPVFRDTEIEPRSPVNFGNEVALVGAGVARPEAQWGRDLGVALQWEALAEPSADYTVFVQLVDEDERLWGQADEPLRDAEGIATSAWQPGTQVTAHYRVALQPGIPPGDYWLDAGLYRWPGGERLKRLDATGNPGSTTYRIGRVHVALSPQLPDGATLDMGRPLDAWAGDGLKLLGVRLGRDQVRSGEVVPVTLFWQAVQTPERDAQLRLRLVGADGKVQGQVVRPLAHTGFPTRQWRPGEIIRGEYRMAISPEALSGRSTLTAELIDASGQALAAPLRLGEMGIEAVSRQMARPAMQEESGARFGERIALVGHDLAVEGQKVNITLYWQALGLMEVSYTAFVHVLGADGRVLAQADRVPADGTRPTTGWITGEYVTDAYRLTLPDDAPSGVYQIEAGLYDRATLQRLPAFDASGNRLPGDRVLFGQIQVGP